ncbi:MAG: NYN domain-containing protein [bacterium]|nr:NYN domain-containing protein [bacterium]
MSKEKAAIFVDNSNIFIGLFKFSKFLRKKGEIKENEYIRIKWEKILELLEAQNSGLDIYARHFFASLPPAADIRSLKHRPTEEEWDELVNKSAQSGFYRVIQNPPFNFTLHGIPLRFADVYCRTKMRQAYFKCKDAQKGNIQCGVNIDPEKCYSCDYKYLFKYEKGVDVALAVQLILFSSQRSSNIDRIILVAGDGDYKEAAKFIRQEMGKDFQIVSWKYSLSKELEKISNISSIYLEDNWKNLCEIRHRPLEETPAVLDEPEIDDVDQAEK